MARVATNPVSLIRAGVALPLAAVDAGNQHSFKNIDGNHILVVKNGSGASVTVTIAIAAKVDGIAVTAGRQVIVAAGATTLIGPFPKDVYNQADGSVYVDFSANASVQVGVVELA